jgi:3-phenylpropionate/cinnamic acid dioxygenase small subunit
MSPLESLLAEREARQVVLAAARLVDAQQWQAFAELFAEDGSLERPDGTLLQGRQAVYQAYAARSPERLTQHILTNHEVTFINAHSAQSRCLVLLWTGLRSDALTAKGRPADAAQQLGEFVDELRLTPEGWRLAKRQARFLFQR